MILLAWIGAYYLRFHAGLAVPQGIPPTTLYFKLIPFIVLIWFITFSAAGFYRRTGKHRSAFTEALDIIQCSFLAVFAFIAFTFFYEEYRYSRIAMAIFMALQIVLVITGRSLVRKFNRFQIRRSPRRHTLLIGSGENLSHATSIVEAQRGMEPCEVGGVILVGNEAHRAEDKEFCRNRGFIVLEQPEDWVSFFTEHAFQSIYIALPHAASHFLEEHLSTIADQVYDINLIPDLQRYSRFSAGIGMVRGMPLITMHQNRMEGLGALAKRAMDIAGALFGLIVLSPAMLVISILVPLSSPGPVLYRQQRMGLDGRSFDCLKFRSMPIDSESNSGAVWATAEDNRATWLGRFLRRTSLDELPQLINVLRGEMSLVGPRPERPVFVNQFRKNVPGYMLRHKVKAGMTGWAQVNGWRGNTSIEKRIECDLYYIQNWTLWLDIKILFKTVEEVVFGRNAY